MKGEKEFNPETTLDPENWASMRALGHRMVDDMLDYLQDLNENPVWRHAPQSIKDHFESPTPQDAQSADGVYEEYMQYVHPYLLGNNHPRFWGWIAGTGTVIGAFAEMLAAATNSPSGAFSYMSANYVENQVLGWFKELLGFPPDASGLITSGCSASNLIGLAVAVSGRHQRRWCCMRPVRRIHRSKKRWSSLD
jgi:glutamate/tyrosine decarboxylase-like PLP-dependent enzyme